MNHSLKAWNTFGIDQQTNELVCAENEQQLLNAWQLANASHHPVLILGEGSNVLFLDTFQGTVIVNRIKGIEITEQPDAWHLHVGAGENWHQLVCYALERNMPGLENLALIPGCVGSSPIQNIGAYGVELQRVCEYVDCIELATGKHLRVSATECRFGYRDSIFKHACQDSHFITAVGLCLPKAWTPMLGYGPLAALGDTPTAQAIFDTVCATRMAKLPDPSVLGNAGSFFKNPVVTMTLADTLKQQYPQMPCYPAGEGQAKLAAGWLIDQCGLKGFAIGRAAVHQEQALVLVNLGGASAMELIALAAHVRDSVEQKFGVVLEHEVRFMGLTGETWLDEVLA